MRLREAAETAKMGNFDYFTTTLSISPLKNAQKLNEIGIRLAKEYGITLIACIGFQEKNGYKRSVELSAEHHLAWAGLLRLYFQRKQRRCGMVVLT